MFLKKSASVMSYWKRLGRGRDRGREEQRGAEGKRGKGREERGKVGGKGVRK